MRVFRIFKIKAFSEKDRIFVDDQILRIRIVNLNMEILVRKYFAVFQWLIKGSIADDILEFGDKHKSKGF